jgi:hypothetical protein
VDVFPPPFVFPANGLDNKLSIPREGTGHPVTPGGTRSIVNSGLVETVKRRAAKKNLPPPAMSKLNGTPR